MSMRGQVLVTVVAVMLVSTGKLNSQMVANPYIGEPRNTAGSGSASAPDAASGKDRGHIA
jgi:hypothetical protein